MMRSLPLGKHRIESRNKYKYALLRAQLDLLVGSICLIYIFIDSFNAVFTYIPLYIIGMATSILVILTNRHGEHVQSSIVLLLTAHLLVFVIAILESAQGAVDKHKSAWILILQRLR